jgi:DNA-binding CsgD family transcriptional regulator
MPVAMILAARPHDARRLAGLTTLAGSDGVTVRPLRPLSAGGAAELVRRSIPAADNELCRECHLASAGNPFLLTELTRELRSAASPPAAGNVAGMAIDRIDRVVARRLCAAGPDAERLAQVASLLGGEALLADVAQITEFNADRTQGGVDALRSAGVLAYGERGALSFVHPLVHSAVERSVPPGHRSVLHLRAARRIGQRDGSGERVGAHLLAVEPGQDAWVRERLVEAGDTALESGAARNAVALYERALAERVSERDPRLLTKLGRAALGIDPAAAEAPLRGALAATPDPVERVPIALDLAVVLQTLRRPADAVEILDRLGSDLHEIDADRGLQLRVQAELLAQAFFDPVTRRLGRLRLAELVGTLTGEREEETLILVQQAVDAINTGTAKEARDLAERAWLHGRLGELTGSLTTPAVMWIPYIRMYVDDYDWTIAVMRDWLEQARHAGSAVLASFANGLLAEAQWRAGALRDAQASAIAAWDIARELGSAFPGWWIATGVLAEVLMATGNVAAARELLTEAGVLDGPPLEVMLMPLPRAVRGEVLLATGDVERGVTELADARDWVDRQGTPSPGGWRFHGTLVDGLLALGRKDEAAEIARGWLRRTRRFGALSTRGMAERAVALCATGDAQLDGLRRAERTLASTPARAEHARALLELGAALRRAGQRTQSRDPLREALDAATRCGATPLAERARVELIASGARPRRDVLTGADALTASERRVAQLAGTGLTNREIAAALFISRKTVERHLANIYAKLDTNDRRTLADALASTQPAS